MSSRLSQPILVGEYSIVGVDDWLVFARDLGRGGRWCYWHTECDPAWFELPEEDPIDWPGLSLNENTLAVGVLMARRGDKPRDIGDDAGTIADLERHFGEKHAA